MVENLLNVKSSCPFFAEQFLDLDTPIFDLDSYISFVHAIKNKLGPFSKYLVAKLHDSDVLDMTIDDNAFCVVLNDISTVLFASAVAAKKGKSLEGIATVFRLELKFVTKKRVAFFTVDEGGFLKPDSNVRLDEYLSEQVLSVAGDQIELALMFWSSGQGELPGKYVIALLTAERVEVAEMQDSGWRQVFGNEYDGYYSYFKQQKEDRYFVDGQQCLIAVNEWL